MRGGVIQQLGSPAEIYHRPANLFVAGFIRTPPMNLLEGQIERKADEWHFVSQSLTLDLSNYAFTTEPVSGQATLGIRPEHCRVDGDVNGAAVLQGQISVIEPMGSEAVVWLDCQGRNLSFRRMGEITFQVGDPVVLGIDPAKASLFRSSRKPHLKHFEEEVETGFRQHATHPCIIL